MTFDDFETEVINHIAHDLEITNGDAQGMVEAEHFFVAREWAKDSESTYVACKIINKG